MRVLIVLFLILIGLMLFAVLAKDTAPYQGPVPEWADEDHFRKTGETKPKPCSCEKQGPALEFGINTWTGEPGFFWGL